MPVEKFAGPLVSSLGRVPTALDASIVLVLNVLRHSIWLMTQVMVEAASLLCWGGRFPYS